ncbi:MAG: ABC transporter substrate-binding protein [Cetobacterium sp.]
MRKHLCLILFALTIVLSFGESTLDFDIVQLDEYSELEKQQEDSLRIVQAIKVSSVDPIFMKDQNSIRTMKYLYDTLFIYNDKNEIVSNLVETWIWKGDRVLEIELKKDIFFHNGDKMLAIDVKNSLDRLLEKGVFKDFFNDIQSVKVISSSAVEIKLKRRNHLFLSMLTYYMCSITKEVENKIYGTGPYSLKKITNKEVVLIKNKNYFKENTGPKKIQILSEISDRKRALLYFNDDADVVLDITPKQIENWQKEGILGKDAEVKDIDELDTVAIMFGQKNKTFEKRKAREAFASLVNRDEVVENVFFEKSAKNFFPENLFKAELSKIKNSSTKDSELKQFKLLNNEIELITLNDDQSLKVGNELKKMLEKKGISIKIVPYQKEAYLMKIEKQDYELAVYNIIFDKKYLIYNLGKVISNDIGDKDMYNAMLPFLEILKEEIEITSRDKIYDNIVYLISKDTPYIPLVHRKKVSIETKKIEQYK